MSKKKKRVARGKYAKWLEPNNLTKLQGWARDGATNEMIAEYIGINPKTLYEWLKKYPLIAEAIEKGKEVIDREVENALLNRALGYTVTLKKERVTKDGDVVEVEEEVHYPGDTTAQIFWLKNRKPREWRDKQELEHSGQIQTENKLDSILSQIEASNETK